MQNAENKMKNIAGVITNSRFLLFVDKSSKISIADILDKLKSEQEKKVQKC